MTCLNRVFRGGWLVLLTAWLQGCPGPNAAPEVTSLTVAPSSFSLEVGRTRALTTTAGYDNGTSVVVTAGLDFATSDAAVAVVSPSGVVTGVAAGSATVTVSRDEVSASVAVTVTSTGPTRTLRRLALTPDPVALQVGSTQTLTVTASYSDDTTATLASQVAFTSSVPSVATVSADGLVTAVSAGDTTVEASFGGQRATVAVSVTAATLESVALHPRAAEVFVGATRALTVVGSFSDGTTATITAGLTFTSSDETVAVVGPEGMVTGIAPGAAEITAAVQGKEARPATVTVKPSPYVFYGEFAPNSSFVGFRGATNDLARDTTELREGRPTLRIAVLAGSAGYAGGAIVSAAKRDLSSFDALTFWAKASKDTTINVFGLGNNSAGASGFEAELAGASLTTTWTKHILPLADPSKLTEIDGLFHFADGPKDYTLWLSDVQYEKLGTDVLGTPSAAINTNQSAPSLSIGDTLALPVGTSAVDFTIDGALVRLTNPGWRYFTLTSDASAIATVSPDGVVTAKGEGQATITATLAGAAATGSLTVSVTPKTAPTTVLAPPTLPAEDVIALSVSGVTNHGVDTWRTSWSAATFEEVDLEGHAVKHYSSLDFAGVETTGANLIDASAMTALHLDIWTSNATTLRVKLVDFGANGAFDGGDDSEAQLALTSSTTPALTTGSWVALELPLADFLAQNANFRRAHLAQLILSAVPTGAANVYVDNVYFHR